MVKIKLSIINIILQNPLFLLIIILLIIIIIIFVFHHFVDKQRKNIIEKFTFNMDSIFNEKTKIDTSIDTSIDSSKFDFSGISDIYNSWNCNEKHGKKNVSNKCICLKNKDEDDEFKPSDTNFKDSDSLTDCQKDLCKEQNFTPN